jgi:hypothetical protein
MTHHRLKASVQNCHWGYFDAARAPVLSIESGDQVTIDCASGAPAVVPKSGYHVPPVLCTAANDAKCQQATWPLPRYQEWD